MDVIDIQNIGIIGGGKIGTDLVSTLTKSTRKITWFVRNDTDIIKNKFLKKQQRLVKNNLLTENEFLHLNDKLTVTNDLMLLCSSDLLIEAVSEDLSVKNSVLNVLQPKLQESCIIGSASSSIYHEEFDIFNERAESFFGIHPFYPLSYHKTIELITCSATELKYKVSCENFFSDQGFLILQQDRESCFLLNRFILEIQVLLFLFCLENRTDPTEVDLILLNNDKVKIPLLNMIDSVGIDIMITSISNYVRIDTFNKENKLKLWSFLFEVKKGRLSFMDTLKKNKNTEHIDQNKLLDIFDHSLNYLFKLWSQRFDIDPDKFSEGLKIIFGIERLVVE